MKNPIDLINAVHPQALPVLVAVITGGIIHAWKALSPASFDRVPAKLKAYPAMIVAAVTTAGIGATSQQVDLVQLTLAAILGSFSGLTAVGGHEMVQRTAKGSKNDRARKRAAQIDTEDAEMVERQRRYHISTAETLKSRPASNPKPVESSGPVNDPLPDESVHSTRGEEL